MSWPPDWRPSRFDRTYVFSLPDLARRQQFLERWAARLDPEVRPSAGALARAADETSGYSFAYLKEVGTATLLAWLHDRGPIDPIFEAQVRKLSRHVRRGDIGRVLGASAVNGVTR